MMPKINVTPDADFSVLDLPSYPVASPGGLCLGQLNEIETALCTAQAYEEEVHCRPNAMQVPWGAVPE